MNPGRYECRMPSPALADVVEGIWIQEDDGPRNEGPGCVVPTGTVELIFNYRDPVLHVGPGGSIRMPRMYVTGQRTQPVSPLVHGRLGLILVSLYPWGLSQLLPDAVEAVDSYTDLKLTSVSQCMTQLEDQLMAAADPDAAIEHIQNCLLQLRNSAMVSDWVCASARLFVDRHAEDSVATMARSLGFSRRHFARHFREVIGVTPKKFSRIMRFQRALRERRFANRAWADIAAHSGFSDQAHLSHEVKHFAGRPPSAIKPDGASDDVFNRGRVSRFFETVYL